MLNERLAQLIARKLAGEATAEEAQELAALLQDHPQAQYFFEVLSNHWNLAHPNKEEEDLADAHIQHLISQADEEARQAAAGSKMLYFPFGKRGLVAAAVIGVMAIAGLLYYYSVPNEHNALSEVVAKPGARSYLLLPDGTKVWLNSASRLTYNGSFNDSIRAVTLEGEAFFDVVKDSTRPFIVHTADVDIRVLGTAFNVKSFPQEAVTEATLLHGAIQVVNKKEPQSPTVILRPHEKLTYSRPAPPADVAAPARTAPPVMAITALPRHLADTALAETSWVYNKLVFEGETFAALARRMERWFGVTIQFRHAPAAQFRFRGAFENENIEQALQALQLTAPFSYSLKDNIIEIDQK